MSTAILQATFFSPKQLITATNVVNIQPSMTTFPEIVTKFTGSQVALISRFSVTV